MTGTTIKGQIQREDLALFDGKTLVAQRPNSSGGTQTGNRMGDAVDVKLIHGGTANAVSFQAALDSMGTANGALLFTPETWTIAANVTVPANVTLIVPAGCVFNINSGITITNNGILIRYHGTYSSGSGTFTQNGIDSLQTADQTDIFGTDTGSTNTYVISTTTSISNLATGVTVRFEASSANTGSCTLNVDGTGAKTLKPAGTAVTMPVGSIQSGGIYTCVYDAGSDIWQVVNMNALVGQEINLNKDSAVIKMGSDSDLTVTHNPDQGITIKQETGGSDDKPIILTLQTGEEVIVADDYLGRILFQAPDETSGGDSHLVSAGISAQAEAGFSTSINQTSLLFETGSSETATAKMKLKSGGNVVLPTDGVSIEFGSDSDTVLSHVHNTGLTLSAGDNDTVLQLDSNNDDGGAAPKLILNRTSASPADNDDGGMIEWQMENDNNQQFKAAQIFAEATDVTDGSEQAQLRITHTEAGTEETDAVYIGHASGKVYIYNNTADLETLRLRQDNASCTNYGVVMVHDGAGIAGYFSTAGDATGLYGYCGGAHYGVRGYSVGSYAVYASGGYSRAGYFIGSGSKYFIASYSSTYGAYSNGSYYSSTNTYTGSDSRLKDVTSQITTSDGILAKVNSLKPIMYTWKENSDGYVKDASPECGFLAQEVKDVFPDLIHEVEVPDCSDELHDNGRDTKTLNEELGTTFGMSYEKLSVYLAAALQEASAKIDNLEKRIAALES